MAELFHFSEDEHLHTYPSEYIVNTYIQTLPIMIVHIRYTYVHIICRIIVSIQIMLATIILVVEMPPVTEMVAVHTANAIMGILETVETVQVNA